MCLYDREVNFTLRRESHVSRPITSNCHHRLQFCLSEGQASRLWSLVAELGPSVSPGPEPVGHQESRGEDQEEAQAGQLQTSTDTQQAVQTWTWAVMTLLDFNLDIINSESSN